MDKNLISSILFSFSHFSRGINVINCRLLIGTVRRQKLHHNQSVELTKFTLVTRKFLLYSQTSTLFLPSFYFTFPQGFALY